MTPAAHFQVRHSWLTSLRAGWLWTLFGVELRYVATWYLQRFFLLVFIILTLVLSLDIASNVRSVLSQDQSVIEIEGATRLLLYASLRAGYDLSGVFPLAMVLAIIWTEMGLATSNERLMILNSGRRVLVSLMPALVVGLVVGALQFGALAYLRPFTVEQQALGGFRGYGPKFHPQTLSKDQWIVLDDAIINARVGFAPGVSLNNLVIYSLDGNGELRSIATAQKATLSQLTDTWQLQNGTIWQVPRLNPRLDQGGSMLARAFEKTELNIALSPVWLENIGTSPALLPQSILRDIVASGDRVPEVTNYQSAYQERFASIFQQVAVALLAAALCIRWFSPRMHPKEVLKIVGFGMLVYFGFSIVAILGSNGIISAFFATLSMPLAMMLSVLLIADPIALRFVKGVRRGIFS